jgi:hypothetical protein
MKKIHAILIEKYEGKTQLERQEHRYVDNVKVHLKTRRQYMG